MGRASHEGLLHTRGIEKKEVGLGNGSGVREDKTESKYFLTLPPRINFQ